MTAKKDDTLYVGIDLGTSQSSISSSSGQRHVVKSLVGWPLDMVSRKILKRDVLIGQDALENRPMLELHRPLERGLIREGSEKDLAAVRELLTHLLGLVGINGKREGGQQRRVLKRCGRSSACRPRRCASTSSSSATPSPAWWTG
jgi:hypothetical protein